MKITLFVFSLFLLLVTSACESKWNREPEGLPDDLKQKYLQLIEENMAVLEKDPNDIAAQFEVAFRYHNLGRYKDAVTNYEKVLALNPDHFATLNNLASIYEEVEEYDQAAKYFQTLYEKNSNNLEVISDTVRILLKNNQPDLAQTYLENFVRLTQNSSDSATQLTVSNLYESISNYNKEHAQE